MLFPYVFNFNVILINNFFIVLFLVNKLTFLQQKKLKLNIVLY